MKISLNWLKDYAPFTAGDAEIARAITFLGFEVEGIERTGAPALPSVVVGEVRTRDKHPNADKLSVCQVDVGPAGGIKTIVCGAQNYRVGDRVPVALPGAVLPGNFVIKQSKIRGQLSDGMMCSGKELGIGEDQSGLLILPGQPPVGAPINSVLPEGDVVFDLEITPNRPDCLCHLGIARELAAWFDLDLRYPDVGAPAPAGAAALRPLLEGVSVEAPEDCPLYTAHVITGVRIGPSPSWLQERLRSVGLRPVNNVVDVGNYVMLEYGQPLHAFDARSLSGSRIVVRRAREGEALRTLDGRDRILASSMLVIADAARPVVIAGILGGENSGVQEGTTELVIEGAIFRPQSIRRTSRALGVSSDSSYRYERGVDPHTTREAVRRALDLIVATAGGTILEGAHVVGGEAPWQREIAVTTRFIEERLGFSVPESRMREALEALELKIAREEPAPGGGLAWTVSIPSWRDDLDRPIDLVEEVLRLFGTDRIPPSPVLAPGLAAEDAPAVRWQRDAMAYLVGHDFHECVNLTLRPAREVADWDSQASVQELALANPFVEDQSHLRSSLIPGLLESLKLNRSRGVSATRLAETGRIFVEHRGQVWEYLSAAFILAEDTVRHWQPAPPADFYAAKRHLQGLASICGLDLDRPARALAPAPGQHATSAQTQRNAAGKAGQGAASSQAIASEPHGAPGWQSVPAWNEDPAWQSGHFLAAGSAEQGWIASCGLVNLARLKAAGITGKVYAGSWAMLAQKLPRQKAHPRYREVSPYPPALRDLALAVDATLPAEAVRGRLEAAAREAAGNAFAVESVDLFDVYSGAGLPPGKKSLAFSFVFRAPDRTLTDAEVNPVFERLQTEAVARIPRLVDPQMSSSPDFDIDHVARLARLALTPEEKARFSAQLADVLSHIAELKSVDVSGVEATAHAYPIFNVWGEDEPRPGLPVEAALRNAPEQREDMVLVPKVVE